MVTVGPTGEEADAEVDEHPPSENVRATVEWAVTTENIELADFEFEDDGAVGPHLQIVEGPIYNLTRLTDARLETTRDVLSEYETEETDEASTHLTVEVDATTEEHKTLVERLFDEVYGVSLSDVKRLRRSTVKVVDEAQHVYVEEMASDPARLRAETEEAVGYEDGDVGGYIQLSENINLNAAAIGLGLENIEYEPDRFAMLIYRLDRPKATVLIFSDGHLTTVDAEDEAAARDALMATAERLSEIDLFSGEVPGRSDVVEVSTSGTGI